MDSKSLTLTEPLSLRPAATLSTIILLGSYSGVTLYMLSGAENKYRYLIVLALVQLTPLMISLITQRIGFLEIFLLFRFLTYTIGKVNAMSQLGSTVSSFYTDATHVVVEHIICSIITIFVYYTFRLLIPDRKDGPYQTFLVKKEPYLFAGVLLSTTSIWEPFVPVSIASISLAATRVMTTLVFCAQPIGPKWIHWAVVGSVAYGSFQAFLIGGSMGSMVTVFSVVFVISILKKNLKRILLLCLPLTLLIFIQAIKGDYRMMLLTQPEMSVAERFQGLAYIATQRYVYGEDVSGNARNQKVVNESGEGEEISDVATAFQRLLDDSLERVLAWTPSIVPFWEGKTLEPLLYVFIPRFVWPGKPTRAGWNEFGMKYGYLNEDDNATSITYGIYAEGYMNFGYWGLYGISVLVGLFLFGFELLSRIYLPQKAVFSALAFLLPALNVETDLVSLIQTFGLILGVLLVIRPFLGRLLVSE